jgi:hypothetical protein
MRLLVEVMAMRMIRDEWDGEVYSEVGVRGRKEVRGTVAQIWRIMMRRDLQGGTWVF